MSENKPAHDSYRAKLLEEPEEWPWNGIEMTVGEENDLTVC